MTTQFQDYILAGTGVANVWVKLVNNSSSTAYFSSAQTDKNGRFQTAIAIPAGYYTVSTSTKTALPAAGDSSWIATGDTLYSVSDPFDSLNPPPAYNPMTALGDMTYGGTPVMGVAPLTRLPIGNTGQIMTVAGGIPTWATQAQPGTVTIRVSHTFSISGALAVASGATNYIPGFFVPNPSAQAVTLRAVRCFIRAGTSATLQVFRNGLQIGSNINCTTLASTTSFSQAVTDQDYFTIVISAVNGGPDGLSCSLQFDYPNL